MSHEARVIFSRLQRRVCNYGNEDNLCNRLLLCDV